MSDTPIHAWMLPRLVRLLAEAEAAGFARSPCVAVIADIMMQPAFNTGPLPIESAPTYPATPVPPITEEYSAPSLGPTEWITANGDPNSNR